MMKACGLAEHMRLCQSGKQWEPATAAHLNVFHTDSYLVFLQQLTSKQCNLARREKTKYVYRNAVAEKPTAQQEAKWNDLIQHGYADTRGGGSAAPKDEEKEMMEKEGEQNPPKGQNENGKKRSG